jgi:hypothetical protein
VTERPHDDEEPPPILGAWRRLYALEIAWLIAIILLLGLITRSCG